MQPCILVPFDFSPAAEAALRWAAELRRCLGGGSIHLIHVVSGLPPAGTVELPPHFPPGQEDLTHVERALREVAERFAPGATVEATPGSHIGEALLAAAKSYRADLIAMGTHGRGVIKRLVLGSVADYMVCHAGCPVATLRASLR